jgi:hypothetical protein
MLPPIDSDVRSSNPKFDALYNDLCNNKLYPDATTKLDAKAQRERDTLSEVRVESPNGKRHMLLTSSALLAGHKDCL